MQARAEDAVQVAGQVGLRAMALQHVLYGCRAQLHAGPSAHISPAFSLLPAQGSLHMTEFKQPRIVCSAARGSPHMFRVRAMPHLLSIAVLVHVREKRLCDFACAMALQHTLHGLTPHARTAQLKPCEAQVRDIRQRRSTAPFHALCVSAVA